MKSAYFPIHNHSYDTIIKESLSQKLVSIVIPVLVKVLRQEIAEELIPNQNS